MRAVLSPALPRSPSLCISLSEYSSRFRPHFNFMRAAWHFYKLHLPIFLLRKIWTPKYTNKKKRRTPKRKWKKNNFKHRQQYNAAAWLQLQVDSAHLYANSCPCCHAPPPPLARSLAELCASRLPCALWGFILAFWLSRRRQATTNGKKKREREQAQESSSGAGWEWWGGGASKGIGNMTMKS